MSSTLSQLDNMVLRTTSNPPLTTKGSALTYTEGDARIIDIYNSVQSIVSGLNVTSYDAGKTYDMFDTDIRNRYASYDSRIWMATYAGSPSTFSGQTPEEGVYWTQVTLAELIPNIMELSRFAENLTSDDDPSQLYNTDWVSFTNQDLKTNPADITGLEAKGAGISIVPVAIDFALDHGGTDYDFPVGGISLIYDGETDAIVSISTSAINASGDVYGTYKVQDNANIKLNKKMQLYSSADATQGDGTYYVKVYYKLVTTPF